MKPRRGSLLYKIFRNTIGVVLALAGGLSADDGTWIGTGTGLSWTDAANWQGGACADATGLVTFAASSDATVALAGDVSFARLYQTGASVTLQGGSVTLGDNFGGANVINVAENRRFTFNTSVAGPGKGLVKRGAGLLYFNAPSTFTGGIGLQEGSLCVDQASATVGDTSFIPSQKVRVSGSAVMRFGPPSDTSLRGRQEFTSLILESGVLSVAMDNGRFSLVPWSLSGPATLSVSGNGAVKLSDTAGHTGLVSAHGRTALYARNANYVSSRLSQVCTNNLVFHMDASETDTLTLSGDEVTAWREAQTRQNICSWSGETPNVATPAGTTHPRLLRGALNGRDVVDLGPAVDDGGMAWLNAVTNIQTVLMVVGSQEGGGTLLGANGPLAGYHFRRGCDLMASRGETRTQNNPVYGGRITRDFALLREGSLFATHNFEQWVNGDAAHSITQTGLSGGYDVVTIRSQCGPCAASAFARCADGLYDRTGQEGGQRLAEVICFSMRLDDATRRRIEQYLLHKWLGRDLRGYRVANIEQLSDNTTLNTEIVYPLGPASDFQGAKGESDPCVIRVDRFTQSAACDYFSLAGLVDTPTWRTQPLELEFSRADWAKKIRLMGDVHVKTTARRISTTCPVAGAALHVDANVHVTTDANGAVTRWEDASGGAGSACANVHGYGAKPTVVANALNGMPVVDFGAARSAQHLQWQTNIMVRAAFFVMKVSNPTVTFMGSTCPEMAVLDNFTRFSNTTNCLFGGTQDGALGGICRINDTRILDPKAAVLPLDEFVVYGQTFNAPQLANAFGCGALQGSNLRAERTGGLQIAEALIFDRALTDDESLDIQAYLAYKWFGRRLVGFALPGERYGIPAVGAGVASSFTVGGTAPAEIKTLFGNAAITLSAPDCVVKIPAPQGNLILNNAGVELAADVAAGKITTAAGTTNHVTGAGRLAALTVNGGFDLRGGVSTNVTAFTFAAGAELLLGAGRLDCHALTLGDSVTVTADLTADGMGRADACELTVSGGGAVRVACAEACGQEAGVHPLLTFGSLSAASQANLANWSLEVTGYDAKRLVPRLRVANNALNVVLAAKGLIVLVR